MKVNKGCELFMKYAFKISAMIDRRSQCLILILKVEKKNKIFKILASSKGNYEVVELLIKSNAAINLTSNSGSTALHRGLYNINLIFNID